MTSRLSELMALADEYAEQVKQKTLYDARDAVRAALESALTAALADERQKALEAAAECCATLPHRSGVNADGQTWLSRVTREDCAAAIRQLKERT